MMRRICHRETHVIRIIEPKNNRGIIIYGLSKVETQMLANKIRWI
jgi:hypothetical protein